MNDKILNLQGQLKYADIEAEKIAKAKAIALDYGDGDLQEGITDLLADLMHVANADPDNGDFEQALDSAYRHFHAELNGE